MIIFEEYIQTRCHLVDLDIALTLWNDKKHRLAQIEEESKKRFIQGQWIILLGQWLPSTYPPKLTPCPAYLSKPKEI